MGFEDLEYRIGGLEIDKSQLGVLDMGERPPHKYVVRQEGTQEGSRIVTLYGCVATLHREVLEHYGFDKDPENPVNIGGGFFSMKGKTLTLNGFSSDYFGLSKSAAEQFAQLLLAEFKKRKIPVTRCAGHGTFFVHSFWK